MVKEEERKDVFKDSQVQEPCNGHPARSHLPPAHQDHHRRRLYPTSASSSSAPDKSLASPSSISCTTSFPLREHMGWAIGTSFVSFDALVQKINTEGIALQGSGWVRLALDKKLKDLVVETTANQMKGSACSHHAHFLKKPREKRR
ncbi:hypothetical protein ACFX14_038026 [Malus domestica]